MNLAELSIRYPLYCAIIVALCVAGGWYAYNNMPRFEDPEFTIRIAKVFTPYPGASPEEVMNEVTEPIETQLQQLPEVKKIESVSSAGMSELSVEVRFEYSTTRSDLQVVWTKIRNYVKDAQRNLPPGAGESIVNDDFGDVYGIYYLMTGEGFSAAELADIAKKVRRELLLVDGVAKVQVIGEQREVIYVEIARQQSSALGISLENVYNTLAQQNTVTPAGNLQLGDSRVVIEPTGAIDSVAAIEAVLVADDATGSLARLGDIANVVRTYEDPPEQLIRYNGEPAIGIGISNLSGVNVVKLGNEVDRKLADLQAIIPLGVQIHEFYHQGKVVDQSIDDFAANVVAALVIVFLTLLVFMGVRSGIIMGLTVLLTMAATLLLMWIADVPMHRISLGALIISLGMLVDNGVVITDGILVGIKSGRDKLDVVRDVANKNFRPLLGGTLVGIIAFAPIGFAPGDTAEFTNSLFWVVMMALGLSWVFAFTITPLLCFHLFPSTVAQAGDSQRVDGRFMIIYKRIIHTVLKFKFISLFATVLIFLSALYVFGFVKVGFFPASTSPQIVVDYYLPEGVDIERTNQDMHRMESFVRNLEGVAVVQTLVGKGALRYMLVYESESTSPNYGQLLVRTDSYELNETLIPKIQAYADEQFPDGQTKVWRFRMGPGGGAKIEASFVGSDPAVLRSLANRAKEIMAADGGAILIKDDWRRQVPVLQPVFSPNKGERVGITRADVANALEENFDGVSRGFYREGDELIEIISRAPESERLQPWAIATIPIVSPTTGESVPLTQVMDRPGATWRDARILRTNRLLTIKAQCDPGQGENTADLLDRIQPKIEDIELPAGYKLIWEGEAGDSSEAQDSLASTIPLGLLAMILVVIVLFNAIKQPIVIWAIVPLAIVGVAYGLVATGVPFEFMGILGLLSLSGLLIQNSLVLVDSTDDLIASGMPRFDALVESAASRLRPVLMGAFTTVLGVLPLYFDAFFKSMTVVIAGGLSFATIITLLVTPVLYALLFGIHEDERSQDQTKEAMS
ncbi:MAG: efflux RND transporter permease subunit [Pseudomonadota bacterium]